MKDIDVESITTKEGVVVAAHCVLSRTRSGVKFRTQYSSNKSMTEDYIILPSNIRCNEVFLANFIAEKIKISYYKNYYLEIIIGDKLIKSAKETINEINVKKDIVCFTLFLAIMASFSLFMFGYHSERRADHDP